MFWGWEKGNGWPHWETKGLEWKFIAMMLVLGPQESLFFWILSLMNSPYSYVALSLKSNMLEYFQQENQLVCHNLKFYMHNDICVSRMLAKPMKISCIGRTKRQNITGSLKGLEMGDSKDYKTWQGFHIKAHQFNLIFSLESRLSKQWQTDRRVNNQVFVERTKHWLFNSSSTDSPVKNSSRWVWWYVTVIPVLGRQRQGTARCSRPAWST